MLTYPRKSVSLSWISTDLFVSSRLETAATLYQKDEGLFHLLLTEPIGDPLEAQQKTNAGDSLMRMLWLEISPFRLVMTMQSNGPFSYRHVLERGLYSTSRYWLKGDDDNPESGSQMQLRNFTRSLQVVGDELPQFLQVEYELWANRVALGRYVLNLEIAP
jgi:hypothetical protein